MKMVIAMNNDSCDSSISKIKFLTVDSNGDNMLEITVDDLEDGVLTFKDFVELFNKKIAQILVAG